MSPLYGALQIPTIAIGLNLNQCHTQASCSWFLIGLPPYILRQDCFNETMLTRSPLSQR